MITNECTTSALKSNLNIDLWNIILKQHLTKAVTKSFTPRFQTHTPPKTPMKNNNGSCTNDERKEFETIQGRSKNRYVMLRFCAWAFPAWLCANISRPNSLAQSLMVYQLAHGFGLARAEAWHDASLPMQHNFVNIILGESKVDTKMSFIRCVVSDYSNRRCF